MINLARGMNTGKQQRRTTNNGWNGKGKVGIAQVLVKMSLVLRVIIFKKDDKMTKSYGCFILKMAL